MPTIQIGKNTQQPARPVYGRRAVPIIGPKPSRKGAPAASLDPDAGGVFGKNQEMQTGGRRR